MNRVIGISKALSTPDNAPKLAQVQKQSMLGGQTMTQIANNIAAKDIQQTAPQKYEVTECYYTIKNMFAQPAITELYITAQAWTKLMCFIHLVGDYEISGFGRIQTEDIQDGQRSVVTDFDIIKQEVKSAYVESDAQAVMDFLRKIPTEQRNEWTLDWHSHVNMGTFASGVDEGYQKDLVAQLGQDMFEIFLILNKKGEHWQRIVDLKTNIVYEKEDIDIGLTECGFDYKAFVDDAAGKLTRDTVTHTATPALSGTYTGAKPQATKCWSYQEAAKAKKQQVQQPEQTQFQYNDPDDDEVAYETPYGWYGQDGKFHSYYKNY